MLDVNYFYQQYHARVGSCEHIIVNGYQILAQTEKIYIVSTNQTDNLFTWLSYPVDGVVFRTNNKDLGIVLFFDDEMDETEVAITHVNRLINVIQ